MLMVTNIENPPYTIFVPPSTKARLERVARAMERTVTAQIERLAEFAEQATLKRLSTPNQRRYLKDQLLFEEAFPGKKRPRKRSWPLPDEGERVPLTARLSPKTVAQLRRYVNLLNCPAAYMLEKLSVIGENRILDLLESDEQREAFKAGKFGVRPTGPGKRVITFEFPDEPNDPPPEPPIDPLADENGGDHV